MYLLEEVFLHLTQQLSSQNKILYLLLNINCLKRSRIKKMKKKLWKLGKLIYWGINLLLWIFFKDNLNQQLNVKYVNINQQSLTVSCILVFLFHNLQKRAETYHCRSAWLNTVNKRSLMDKTNGTAKDANSINQLLKKSIYGSSLLYWLSVLRDLNSWEEVYIIKLRKMSHFQWITLIYLHMFPHLREKSLCMISLLWQIILVQWIKDITMPTHGIMHLVIGI